MTGIPHDPKEGIIIPSAVYLSLSATAAHSNRSNLLCYDFDLFVHLGYRHCNAGVDFSEQNTTKLIWRSVPKLDVQNKKQRYNEKRANHELKKITVRNVDVGTPGVASKIAIFWPLIY